MANTRELTLPVLPLSNGVVFPHMVVTLRTETDESRTAVAAAEESDGLLLLVSKLNGTYATCRNRCPDQGLGWRQRRRRRARPCSRRRRPDR